MKTLIRLVILLLAVTVAWLIREQLIESSHRRIEEHQWVRLIDEPPPPPPKVEQPPEPEPIQEIPEEELQDIIEEPPEEQQSTDDALGVDEEGRVGSDSFGLRSKKGGRDLLQSGAPTHRGHLYLA